MTTEPTYKTTPLNPLLFIKGDEIIEAKSDGEQNNSEALIKKIQESLTEANRLHEIELGQHYEGVFDIETDSVSKPFCEKYDR